MKNQENWEGKQEIKWWENKVKHSKDVLKKGTRVMHKTKTTRI